MKFVSWKVVTYKLMNFETYPYGDDRPRQVEPSV
jgi:hypothetical protein